jgi:hypothetical protein
LSWFHVPGGFRAAAEAALGCAVVGEQRQGGGFSPGLASRLVLADGRRVFAKAISSQRNPSAPGLYRREAAVMAALPEQVPAPKLLWSHDDEDWVMLILEDVDAAMPKVPWDARVLERVTAAMADLSELVTPSPLLVPSVGEDLAENFQSWRKLAGDPVLAAGLGPWASENVALLAALENGWQKAASGRTLVHGDLRADNMLVDHADRVVFIDWPYAVTGTRWLDMLMFLPSAAADGGVDPEEVWSGYGPARFAEPSGVNAVLAALAGDWSYQALLPAPVNVPGLRAHQASKAEAALEWLRSRLR